MQWFEEIFFEKFFRGIGAWRFLGATGRVSYVHADAGFEFHADGGIGFHADTADRADFFDFVDGYHSRLVIHWG